MKAFAPARSSIVLDEVTALPEGIAGLAERLGLQAELGLDDGSNHETTVAGALAQDAPHVLHVHGGPIIQAQEVRGKVEVVDLAVLDIAHTCIMSHAPVSQIIPRVPPAPTYNNMLAGTTTQFATLVVADGQGQEGAHHGAAIDDVAVEEQIGVGDFHLLAIRVDVVHQGIHGLREVVGGAHVHVGSRGGLGREVGGGGQVVVARLGLHDVRNQHVLAVPRSNVS